MAARQVQLQKRRVFQKVSERLLGGPLRMLRLIPDQIERIYAGHGRLGRTFNIVASRAGFRRHILEDTVQNGRADLRNFKNGKAAAGKRAVYDAGHVGPGHDPAIAERICQSADLCPKRLDSAGRGKINALLSGDSPTPSAFS